MAETALSTHRFATLQKYRTAGYFTAFVALGLAYASLGPTLTYLAANVGAGLQHISYSFSARGLGYLVGSVIGGRSYDLVKGNPFMAAMLVLVAVLLAAIPMVPVLWLLIGVIFLLGIFEGAIDVGGNTLLIWVHGDEVDPYMNALHFFFGVGAFLSPIIVAQAIVIGGSVRWAYWVIALLMLPVAGLLLRLSSPAGPGRQTKVDRVEGDDELHGTTGSCPRQDYALVALIAVFFFLYVGVEGTFGGWIATYAEATGLGDAATAAYLTSAFWGALTVGRLLSIPIGARFSPRQVLLGDLTGCLVSITVLLLWPRVPAATWIGTLGAGLAMASVFPTTLSLAERHTTITGTITSFFFVGGSIGGMTIPWLIGQLFERVGPQVTTSAMMGAAILAFLVFGIIVIHTRSSEKKVAYG
ncbi:MAG: MFS transporter [Anaerolineae bacterium]